MKSRPDGARWRAVLGTVAAAVGLVLVLIALAAMAVTLSINDAPLP